MAKKNKEIIILEDVELKPQVIGYTYKKKSNIGRVIIMFIIFLLSIYYINDISVYINKLLGKETSSSISNLTNDNNKLPNNGNNVENKIVYNIFSNNLEVVEKDIVLKNFKSENNILTMDVINNSNSTVDYSNKKYFIELYSENKTLLERHKIDFEALNENETKNYTFEVTNSFYYFVLEEKTINDYPVINLQVDINKNANLTCIKNNETIEYKFNNNELIELKHTISESDTSKDNYYNRYSYYQNIATTYNNMNGITATFNGSLNGYTTIIAINLEQADLKNIKDTRYYSYKEQPKVVNFEMQTYGYTCN